MGANSVVVAVRGPAAGVLLVTALACSSNNTEADAGSGASGSGTSAGEGGGGAGGAGGGATSGTGGSAPGQPGWTLIPLLDDSSDPEDTVVRAGNDRITGIHFESLDDGWVTTTAAGSTVGSGGAVYKATHDQLTDLLFSGNRDGLCKIGSIDFTGLEKTKDGFVAMAHACDVVASHDGGKSFGIDSAVLGDPVGFGIEDVLAVRYRASDALLIADTGHASVTPGAIGPSSVWTAIWAPGAVPPVPDPVPADQCSVGPSSPAPTQRSSVYVSPDGELVAYTASPDYDPQICLSKDGGKSFFPKLLPGIVEEALASPPSGVTYANGTTGIAWGSNIYTVGAAYIHRTTDGGDTWTQVDVPADVAGRKLDLASAFFAPDGAHGWIVGYDYDNDIGIALRTNDGGASWESTGGDLAQKLSAMGAGKLFTGFALDANRIWVGGEKGVLAANEAGGE